MPIRDLLQAQIEQMGQAIGKMISKFLGLKNDGKMEEAIQFSQTTMQEKLGLDFEKLVRLEKEKFRLFFKDKPYSAQSFEMLSTYFYEVGLYKKANGSKEAKMVLEKAIDLLKLADKVENSLSMERLAKREEIERIIEEN